MGYNDTPSANRIHIGFFGQRNAGKSSLVNAVTGQSLSVVSDVAGIAEEVHRLGIPLIVDEAHGGHFGFHPAFPENAVKYADAVIMSVHKTLPAFTQTALLHLCSDRIDQVLVQRFLGIYETSSPSYILMAGIEKSLEMIRKQGTQLFDQYADMLGAFRKETDDIRNFKILCQIYC